MLQHPKILDLVQNDIPQADLYDYDTAFWRYSAIPLGAVFFVACIKGSKGILTLTDAYEFDAYELLRCGAAPAILQTFEIRWFTT